MPWRTSSLVVQLVLLIQMSDNTADAFLFVRILFGRCAGEYTRCGILGLGVAMYKGTPGSDNCTQICAYVPMTQEDEIECGLCEEPSNSPMPTPPRFDIFMDDDPIPVNDRVYFRRAANTWKDVVVGDLESWPSLGLERPDGGCAYPTIINDLYVCCQYSDLDGDGQGSIVATAAITSIREGPDQNGLPVAGRLRIDKADVATLKEGEIFQEVVEHELAHILGIGSLWNMKGLNEVVSNTTCNYLGEAAKAEYEAITRCTTFPTSCGHWSEECMANELMTPTLDSTNPVSRITVAALEDLGYEVDYSAADAYNGLSIGDNSCFCFNNRDNRDITTYNSPKRQALSAAGRKRAEDHGRSVLKEDALARRESGMGDDQFERKIYILYIENDQFHSVVVES